MSVKNYLNIIAKLSLFNVKKVLFSIYGIVLLIIPCIVAITYTSIIPIDHAVTAIFTSSLAASSLFVFASTFFEYDKSSLRISTLNVVKRHMYFISIFITIFVISYLIIFEVLFIIEILNYFDPYNSIVEDIIQENLFYSFSYNFLSINFTMFFYYISMTILLNISIAFFIQIFAKSMKNYMLVSVAYFLIVMVFADSLVTNYSLFPVGYFIDENTFQLDPNYSYIIENTLYINPVSTVFNPSLNNGEGGYENVTFEVDNYMWWIKLLIPQTYLNKIFFLSFSNPQLSSNLVYVYNGSYYSDVTNLHFNYFSNLTIEQIFVLGVPIFWISILSLTSFIFVVKND